MNKIGNHAIWAAITAAALAAVTLTGCEGTSDECDGGQSMVFVDKVGGTSGGGGARGGSSGSKGGGFSKGGGTSKNKSPKGGTGSSGKSKGKGVKMDSDDCDTDALSLSAVKPPKSAQKPRKNFQWPPLRFEHKPGDRPGDRLPKGSTA